MAIGEEMKQLILLFIVIIFQKIVMEIKIIIIVLLGTLGHFAKHAMCMQIIGQKLILLKHLQINVKFVNQKII